MIPLTLTLKNFMCYRDNVPTLHLEGVHVACLCGANGHGKSALLDAITWALWGEARARTQDELVHQGQRDMQVDLEFLARGTRYRVSRRHTRPRSGRQGATSLELQVASDDGYRPISGNTIRETADQIRQLLSMDYDTFINSAFLLQGRADEFTRHKPTERKRVLAEILNLSLYDRLKERAKDAVATRRQEAALLLDQVERLQLEAERRTEYQTELTSVQQELEQLLLRLDAQEKTTHSAQEAYRRLLQAQEELEQLRHRLREAQEQANLLQPQVQTHQQRVQGYRQALENQQEVEDQQAHLQQARTRLEELNQKLGKESQLQQQKAGLEQTVALARQRLEQEAQQLQQEITQRLDPLIQVQPALQQQLDQARERLGVLEEEEGKLQQQRQRLQEVAGTCQTLTTQRDQVQQDGKELRTKLELLQRDHDAVRCPLCKTELGQEGRHHLATSYEDQIQERLQEYRELDQHLHTKEAERAELERPLQERERTLDQQRASLQRQTATLEQQHQDAQQAAQRQQQLQAQLKELSSALIQGQFAVAEQGQLRQVEEELQSLGYDPRAHAEARQQVQSLEPVEEAYHRLKEARQRLPEEQQALEQTQTLLAHSQQATQRDQERQQVLERQVADLPQTQGHLEEAQIAQRDLAQRQAELAGRRAVLEQYIRDSHAREQEAAQKTAQWQQLQQELGVFTDLATAFGKGGIQALLIEAAIPELEAEANELLGRLTEGRMALKLETQRERRTRSPDSSGAPVETLDIVVSDELGSRSYELFSGGEAFRINFALRIALSKLLARRAGAPLPTLFIDEGFGTQDAQGRERLLEAIKAIEQDFERIIVITHIEELKDAFPVRIEVIKTEEGSTFWLT